MPISSTDRSRPVRLDAPISAVIGVCSVLFVLVLIEPIGTDNAVLHSIARDWIYYRRTPYIGSWDNNFPGIMLLHALEISLLGLSGVAFRAFDVAIQLAFVAFFYKFLTRWLPQHTSALAAVLYAAYYVAGSTYLFGQQDGYGMMAVLVAIAILTKKGNAGILRIAASALVVGISVLMRPTFLLYPGLISLYLLFDPGLHIQLRRLPQAVLYFLLSLVPLGILLLYYANIPGGLDAFYTSTIRFNLDLYTKLSGGSLWIELARTGLLLPFAAYGLYRVMAGRMSVAISRRDAALYVALIVGGLFTVVLMGKYWRYQFAPFFMALIPLSAAGIDEAISYIRSEVVRHYVMIAAVICCSFIYYNPTAPLAFASGLLQHRDPFETATLARRRDPETGALAEREVLTYLNDPSRVHKSVEICGFDPYLRLDLSRPTVGPYVTFHSVGFRRDSNTADSYTLYQRQWQLAYVQTLRQHSPDILVLNRKSPFWYLHDIYSDVLERFDGFPEFLAQYHRTVTIGGFEIYER